MGEKLLYTGSSFCVDDIIGVFGPYEFVGIEVKDGSVMLVLKKEDGTCIRCSKDWLELHAEEVCIL